LSPAGRGFDPLSFSERIAQLVRAAVSHTVEMNEEQGRNVQTEVEFAMQGIPFI